MRKKLIGLLVLCAVNGAFAQSDAWFKSMASKERMTVNFVNTEIEAVSRTVALILNKKIVVDPRVKGLMSLYSDDPLTPKEIYLTYLSAIRGLGFTVVEIGDMLKVLPEMDAKLQSSAVGIGQSVNRSGDQVFTQVFPLTNENVNDMVAILRPLISPNNTINANIGNNSLIITDYAENLKRIAKIIAAVDVPPNQEVEIIPLNFAMASDIASSLSKLLDSSSIGQGMGMPGASAKQVLVMPDTRSNAIMLRTNSAAKMQMAKGLIEKLDRQQSGGPAGRMFVVGLKNADAVKLAEILRAAFGSGSSGAGGGASGGINSSQADQRNMNLNAGGGGSGGVPTLGPSASPSTGGFIQADPATNSLIISAPEPLYRQIRAMIESLDQRRAQIYIESMIVEISGDDAADFGFQWQGVLGNKGSSNLLIGGTNFGANGNIINISAAAGAVAGGGSAPIGLGEGLNIGLVHNFGGVYALASIAKFLQTKANTNIVSTPNLITLDNEEAKIVVGSNVPFVTGQYTNTGSATTNPFQTVERKDVGITLKIKPQIGENGAIKLIIFQESSSVSEKVAPGTSNVGPTTNKRSIESTVIVDDGSILVLGGLIEDRISESNSKVPLLGDLPMVGGAFKSTTRTKSRTNMMVFLRPVIMRDGQRSEQVSQERYEMMQERLASEQPKVRPTIDVGPSPMLPARTLRFEPAISAPKSSSDTTKVPGK